jgi:hypothetical protein
LPFIIHVAIDQATFFQSRVRVTLDSAYVTQQKTQRATYELDSGFRRNDVARPLQIAVTPANTGVQEMCMNPSFRRGDLKSLLGRAGSFVVRL